MLLMLLFGQLFYVEVPVRMLLYSLFSTTPIHTFIYGECTLP
jgi:hypothetical protein